MSLRARLKRVERAVEAHNPLLDLGLEEVGRLLALSERVDAAGEAAVTPAELAELDYWARRLGIPA